MSAEQEIKAIKTILSCYFEHPADELARNALIRSLAGSNESIKTYAMFDLHELKKQLEHLQTRPAGATLADGLPLLRQNLSLSPPSIPPESEHASCRRTVCDLPFRSSSVDSVLSSSNTVWRKAKQSITGETYLPFTTEDDIVYIARTFLEDVILAQGLISRLTFSAEISIKQVRADLCVLLLGNYLVGVVEVKKPGKDVLLQPTVLGELLDQMLLVEGFYGMGPVLGILTTGEEWLVAWFDVDSRAISATAPSLHSASFTTPTKAAPSDGRSPPGGTPSQQAGVAHTVDALEDGAAAGADDNAELAEQMTRHLCTTEVVSIYSDRLRVLTMLCSAFHVMNVAHMHHTPHLSRCLLMFHKNTTVVTFHPASYSEVYKKVDFSKFPAASVKTLVALEDLGRGSSGKAWLCATLTKPRSAACVVKFDNKHTTSNNLATEKQIWDTIYPEFAHMVKHETWSGADGLIMPHFASIVEQERAMRYESIKGVLISKFANCGKVHTDVRWRNIGKYKARRGEVVIVLYDLLSVVDYDAVLHADWVNLAMLSLYPRV